MRRSILIALSGTALAGAMAVGPFGAAAAAPYVYGCTPAMFPIFSTTMVASLSIYNGSASTANLTLKALAGNGHILNPSDPFSGIPVTTTLPPTHTQTSQYVTPSGTVAPWEGDGTAPASIRIVSNVPVAASLSLIDVPQGQSVSANEWHMDDCMPMQP